MQKKRQSYAQTLRMNMEKRKAKMSPNNSSTKSSAPKNKTNRNPRTKPAVKPTQKSPVNGFTEGELKNCQFNGGLNGKKWGG